MTCRLILWFAAVSFVLTSIAAPASELGFEVIVHPDNPATTITRSSLERLYRRSVHYWHDGTSVRPVNLPFDHALRRRFSREVLRSSIDSLVTFWNRMYFRGTLPPIVLKSPQSVRAYVAKTPGAIGYVPATGGDSGVKRLELKIDD